MSTALESVSKLQVESVQVAPNQARILEAFHAVKVDSGSALAEGTQVTYTDPDLGLVFVGKITDVKEAWRNGEGIRYTCADAYRTLTKTPASILVNGLKETRLHFVSGTSCKTILEAIFAGSSLSSVLPGGLNFAMTDFTVVDVDKGGQSIDTWLKDLLENSAGAIAWVDPNGGSPRLNITDYTAAASVTLLVGSYDVISPSSGQLLLEGGEKGRSLNRKYERVMVQGCGYFKRYEMEWLLGEIEESDPTAGYWKYRFYVPNSQNKRLVCEYLDADGKCKRECRVRVQIGLPADALPISPNVFDTFNPPWKVSEDGRIYFSLIYKVSSPFQLPGGAWPPPRINVWGTYTLEEGPMVAEVVSSDPKLAGEGAYVEQHPEFVKYEGPGGNIDQSAMLTALANALAARYCDAADVTGSLGVHIKGLNTSLTVGSPITNFSNAKVQTIQYDTVSRTINLSVSTVPIRDAVRSRRQESKDETLEGGNWYQPRIKEVDNCFCNTGNVSYDESGHPSGGGGGDGGIPGGGPPGGGKGPSWDCNQLIWDCEERPDAGGAFRSLDDCRAACKQPPHGGFKFVKCVGCMPSQNNFEGPYNSEQECKDAHPPNSAFFMNGCKYACDPGIGCTPVENGPYATWDECQANCTFQGSGYGGSGGVGAGSSAPNPGSGPGSGGFSSCPCSQALKGISIGADGSVVGVSWGDVNPKSAGSGAEGYCVGEKRSTTVLKDIVLNGDGTWTKYFVTLTYCGDEPSESDTTESCDCGGYGA